jgi:hypothetical protein
MIPNYRNSEPIWGHNNRSHIIKSMKQGVKRGHSEVAPARLVAAAYILDPSRTKQRKGPYHMHIVKLN